MGGAELVAPSRRLIGALLILLVVTLGLSLAPGLRAFRLWAYMRPYYRLVRARATESAIVAQEGRPNKVLVTDVELQDFARGFPPFRPVTMRVESKVLVYWADPWRDGEGYCVYVFLDKRHRAYQAVMGGG